MKNQEEAHQKKDTYAGEDHLCRGEYLMDDDQVADCMKMVS